MAKVWKIIHSSGHTGSHDSQASYDRFAYVELVPSLIPTHVEKNDLY